MADEMIEIEGLGDLQKLLEQFTGRTQRRLNLNALMAMGRVIVKDAKRRVPVRTGALKKAITVKRPRRGNTVKIGFKPPASRYAHLVEFGTGERVQKKSGRSTGRAAAQPFLRPAIDAQFQAAFEKYGENMLRGLLRESEKLKRTGR